MFLCLFMGILVDLLPCALSQPVVELSTAPGLFVFLALVLL